MSEVPKIYKLIDKTTNMIYIGSTKLKLEQRLKNHINHYKFFLIGKHNYVSSFEILKNQNFEIQLVEFVEDSSELLKREYFYVTTLDCVNRIKPMRTADDIKAQNKKQHLKFKLNNPEKYKEYQDKRTVKILCTCGVEVSKRNIARHIKSHKNI